MSTSKNILAFLIDLDGTVYRGEKVIAGAIDFINKLNQQAIAFLFVTNRGNRTPLAVAKSLQSMGIDCTADNILTSSVATADHLSDYQRCYWIGEQGLDQAMRNAGIAFDDSDPEIVVVGYDRDFNYQKLTLATRLILNGADFVATNTDSIITVEDGVIPEAGPLVAAIENATNIKAKVVGKPHPLIISAACKRLAVSADQCVIIGDNLQTDILAGINNGLHSALVLTGVAKLVDVDQVDFKPTWVFNDLHELCEALL